MSLRVYRSNRTEKLVEVLAEVVARPKPDPCEAEWIVVQGRGMERWLDMELAQRLGVWANSRFPFPRALVEDAFAAVLGEPDAGAVRFEPRTLTWTVARLLPELGAQPGFEAIAGYLADEGSLVGGRCGPKLLQLAGRIASAFDRYQVYRPEMVLAWEQGQGHVDDWQAQLWRAVVERHGACHTAARARAFFDALARGATLSRLPERVSLFGISALPPLYVHVLAAIAERIDVYLFALSPSRQYWGDIRSEREVIRELVRAGATAERFDEALCVEVGNPLLASLGRLHRDFQRIIESQVDYHESDRDLYVDPAGQRGAPSMLELLQSDILALHHRGRAGGVEAMPARTNDASIAVHSCHSPMRQLEALHDQLRALLEADPTLEPRHIVVMMPTVEEYAPLVEAVFGASRDPRQRIPYGIADRSARAASEIAGAFLSLLGLLESRMSAPDVADLLSIESVRSRFGIGTDELDQVRSWIAQVNIRWGVDAEHRVEVGQPDFAENTWRFGLDRLLLGHGMIGDDTTLYGGVLPFDDIEGDAADLLGRFVDFCDTLFAWRKPLQRARSLDEWRADLLELLQAMVARTEDNLHEHQAVRDALDDLALDAARAGFTGTLDLATLRAELEAALEESGSAFGFLAGGVTFCQLMPMRSIPFRVVCLLGMQDDAFPRLAQPVGFDRIAQHPEVGDRSPREDDRYLFLEALLSARDRFLVFYTGQDIQTNSVVPPSVLVGELLDVIDESFQAPPVPAHESKAPRAPADDEPGAAELAVLRHPLQPFSRRYFGAAADGRLFSYSAQHCDGARAAAAGQRRAPPFLTSPYPEAEGAGSAVSVDELVWFFDNPTRAFLKNRLGLSLGEDLETLRDREPVALDALEAWSVSSTLLERCLAGHDLDEAHPLLRASGVLPVGTLGELAFDGYKPGVRSIAALAGQHQTGGPRDVLAVDLLIGDTALVGTIGDLWEHGRVETRFVRLRAKWELGAWIRHLALCAADVSTETATRTVVVGRASKGSGAAAAAFAPVPDAAAQLANLIEIFRLGQRVPIAFFPNTARAYAETLSKARTKVVDPEASALDAARSAYLPGFMRSGECEDAYVAQVFADLDPIHPNFRPLQDQAAPWRAFADLARAVFDPLLAHREVVR